MEHKAEEVEVDKVLANSYVLDIEVNPNYCLVAWKKYNENIKDCIEVLGNSCSFSNEELHKLYSLVSNSNNFIVTYNGVKYDEVVIDFILTYGANATTTQIYHLSKELIKSKLATFKFRKDKGLAKKYIANHIDLFCLSNGRVSLKALAVGLGVEELETLPYDPDSSLTVEQAQHTKNYCFKDLKATELLTNYYHDDIGVRLMLADRYNDYSFLTVSTSTIVDKIYRQELGLTYDQVNYIKSCNKQKENSTFRVELPNWLKFKTRALANLKDEILATDFTVKDGKVILPSNIEGRKIKIGGNTYTLGIGGLHSKEKKLRLFKTATKELIDADVESYYPSIIQNLKLFPKLLGSMFNKILAKFKDERLDAKHNLLNVLNMALKLLINSTYGLTGSTTSILYEPSLMATVTLTGQLSLLMLIEELELNGIAVFTANTDGIGCEVITDKKAVYNTICNNWMIRTNFNLEFNYYKAYMARDVNCYIAQKVNGKMKIKGDYGSDSPLKRLKYKVIFDLFCNWLSTGKPISKDFSTWPQDINKYLLSGNVTGGAYLGNKLLGKTVRYFFSNRSYNQSTGKFETVATGAKVNKWTLTAKDGRSVPLSDNCEPLMNLISFKELSNYLDFDRYLDKLKEFLIKDLGFSNEEISAIIAL